MFRRCRPFTSALPYRQSLPIGPPADKGDDNDNRNPAAATDPVDRHNQSVGWVMGGDMKFMILQSANGTSSRQPPKLRVV
jgi:hypothetical protein